MVPKIRIKTTLNGWRVKFGNQEILFTDKAEMLEQIIQYLDDPKTVEDSFKEAINYKRIFDFVMEGGYLPFTMRDINDT